MAYTKAQIVEQVFLKLHGGKPSPDIAVQRVDIASLLPAAMSEALLIHTREERRDKIMDIRTYGASALGDSPHEFLTTYEVTPTLDEDRDLYYLLLPASIQSLPFSDGLGDVEPLTGSKPYQRVASRRVIRSMPNIGTIWYWYERYADESERIYLSELSEPECSHLVKVVLDVNELSDNDIVPIPAGMQMSVIDRMVAFFQDRPPADNVIDDRQDFEQ
jgi:hypothetical protein